MSDTPDTTVQPEPIKIDLAEANADPAAASAVTDPAAMSLDELLAASVAEVKMEVKAEIPFAGRLWKLVEPTNYYVLFSAADITEDIARFLDLILAYIHPEERADFAHVLRSLPVLPADFLLKLFNRVSELVADRPTGPSGS